MHLSVKRLIFLLLLGCGILQAGTPFISAVNSFGTPTTSVGARPNMGFNFVNTTGAVVTVDRLGMWVRSGNNQTHVLSIYNSSAVQVATVTVDTNGATPDTWLWGDLPTPYEIPIGANVNFTCRYANGGDSFYQATNTGVTIQDIGFIVPVYVGGDVFKGGNIGATYTSVGPVNFQYTTPTKNWTKLGSVYTLGDVEVYTVNSAIRDATAGDTLNGPAGTATWGIGGYGVTINKAVTVRYAGSGLTTINISSTAPTQAAGGAVNITSNATFGGVTMVQPGGNSTTAIRTSGVDGWRVTDVRYVGAAVDGYFIYATNYGLVDNCYIDGGSGGDEWIFMRGPSNAWTTDTTLGTGNAVYLENNTFYDQGYFDANSNAKVVARFNTVTPVAATVKFDVHGYSTNNPQQSGRSFEMYNNSWTTGVGTAFELRGGSGMVFNNTTVGTNAFYVEDYGYVLNLTVWGNYQTPSNYPLFQQIGSGPMATVDATDLVNYQRAQIVALGDTDWQAIGAAPGAVAGSQFTASGPASVTASPGTALVTQISEPTYLWGNLKAGGVPWTRTPKFIGTASTYATNPAGHLIGATTISLTNRNTLGSGNGKIGVGDAVVFAGADTTRYLVTSGISNGFIGPVSATITISPGLAAPIVGSVVMTSGPLTSYQRQTANTSATFNESDIIRSNRDFFASAGFDTNTGVAVGLFDDRGTAVGKTGQGYWATDRGTWNTQNDTIGTPGYQKGQGQLYVSDGADWNLYYEPYRYPHPLQGTPPGLLTATINEAGNVLTLVWTESCTTGAGGNGGVTLTASGGAVTVTLPPAGSGSNTYTYSLNRTIAGNETVTTSYTQPGNGIESTANGSEVPSYTNAAVTNNSTAGAVINATTINVGELIIGP